MRPMFEYIKDRKDLVGVEVGVLRGDNAFDMLSNLDISRLFLVDPYLPYFEDGYLQKDGLINRYKAKKKLQGFKDKIMFIYEKSAKASSLILDNTIDFIYIDANHKQEYVYQDIILWWNKVKPNGVIGGHDFDNYHTGVSQAVAQFLDERNLELTDAKDGDWWIEK